MVPSWSVRSFADVFISFRPWLLSLGTSWTGCSTLLASLPPEPLHARFHQLWFPLDFPVLFHHLIFFLSTRAPTRSQTNNLSPGMPRSGAGDGISGMPGGRTPGPLRFSLREERFLVRCCSSDAAPLGSQRKETEVGQAVPPPLPSAQGGDRHHSVALTLLLPLKRKQLQRRRRRNAPRPHRCPQIRVPWASAASRRRPDALPRQLYTRRPAWPSLR